MWCFLGLFVQMEACECFFKIPNLTLQIHYYFLKFCENLRQIHTSANYYKYSFFPAAVVYRNRLPCSVVTLPTLDQFSVAVRSHDYQMF